VAPSRPENSASGPQQHDPSRQNTNRRCSPPTAIYAHSCLRCQISSYAQPVSLRSVVRWLLHGIQGDGSTHVPGRGSPAARWSLELAEKVSNYLNICRIHKSSRSPARPQVSSDAIQPSERWPESPRKNSHPRGGSGRPRKSVFKNRASAVQVPYQGKASGHTPVRISALPLRPRRFRIRARLSAVPKTAQQRTGL